MSGGDDIPGTVHAASSALQVVSILVGALTGVVAAGLSVWQVRSAKRAFVEALRLNVEMHFALSHQALADTIREQLDNIALGGLRDSRHDDATKSILASLNALPEAKRSALLSKFVAETESAKAAFASSIARDVSGRLDHAA